MSNQRLFAVELRTVAIVIADSMEDAIQIADEDQRDILGDCEIEIDGLIEVNTSRDAANYGWDERCIPYGGDGNTALGEVLKEIAERPPVAERCTRTLELDLSAAQPTPTEGAKHG